MKHGWEYKKIKDVCTKGSSNLQQNKIVELIGDYPVFGASGFVQNIDTYQQERPYIGIVKDGSGVGRVNTYPAKSSLLGTMQYIIPNNNINLGYVAYCLQSLKLSKFASGAAIPHIYFRDYGETYIPVPPLPVQEDICSLLDKMNRVIEAKKEQLKELDNLAQAMFYEMFGDPITNEKGWSVKKMGEVCQIDRGGSPRPIDQYITDDPNGINWIKIGDATDGGMVIKTVKEKIRPEGVKKSRFVHKGDFLLSNSMSFGKPYILGVDGCIHDGWLVISDEKEVFDKVFLYYFLGSPQTYECFKKMAVGGVVNNLNKEMVKKLNVMIPPQSNQQAFAEKVEAIEQQKELINQSIKDVQILFDAKMDYYFGE